VAIFFVLSGFLLYRPFVAARLEGRKGPSVRRYARRRVLRIIPAYWVALIVLGLTVPQYLSTPVFSSHWWATFPLIQSWSSDTIVDGISVAWSLSVEAMFYLLLPVYAWAMRRATVRLELGLLLVTGVLAAVIRVFPDGVYQNTLPGMWAWFAGGLSLAVLSANGSLEFVRRHAFWFWAAAFGCLTIAAWGVGLPRTLGGEYSHGSRLAEHVLYLGVALCLVAPATVRSSLPVLNSRPLAWLGLVSYGIFLYHQVFVGAFLSLHKAPLGFVVYTLAVCAATIACAALSYYLVERPLLRFKEPTGGARTRTRAQAVAAKSES
jgi:peptidoglycan/LPS O-acetylase OafA/YrhL